MCNPPKKGINSPEVVALFEKEKKQILDNLTLQAGQLYQELNKMKGLACQKIGGSMYGFPRVFLTRKAIEEAKRRDIEPDELFCMEMLDNTGIIAVPGAG